MDIREIRRKNLKKLMDDEFGIGSRGAQSRLAERLGKPQNFISRCLAEPGKSGAKTIGEDFAREIEDQFGLDRYALDKPITSKSKIAFDQLIYNGEIDLKGISDDTPLSTLIALENSQLLKKIPQRVNKERVALGGSLAEVRTHWHKLSPEERAEAAQRLLGGIEYPLATLSLLIAICDAVAVGAFSEEEVSAFARMVNARRNHHVHHGSRSSRNAG